MCAGSPVPKKKGGRDVKLKPHLYLVWSLRFIVQKISEIHRVTKLRNCSFNQFALVVPRRTSDRECTVLGSHEYSSEKQVQRKNTAALAISLLPCMAEKTVLLPFFSSTTPPNPRWARASSLTRFLDHTHTTHHSL